MTHGYPSISGEDWLSRNSDRSYPIMEDCSPELLTGDPLPRNILVDAMLVVALQPSRVSIVSVVIRSTSISVEFGCDGVSIGSAKAILGVNREGDQIPIESKSHLCAGWAIFGSILSLSPGTLSSMTGVHPMSGVLLESRCLVFSGPSPVQSISAWAGDEGKAAGDVQIITSDSLTVTSEEGVDGSFTVTVGLTTPSDLLPDCIPPVLSGDCGCDGAVKFINGVTGDELGNLTILIISPPGAPAGSIWAHPTKNAVSALVTTPKKFLCIESPIVPDSYGRLGPDFNSDCPPVRDYGLGFSGPNCTNPPPVIPSPIIPEEP